MDAPDAGLTAVWNDVMEEIADGLVSPQQRAFLRQAELRAIVHDTVLLSVPDTFTRDQIEIKLRPTITEALSRRLGRPVQVAVTLATPDRAAGFQPTLGGLGGSSPVPGPGAPPPRSEERRVGKEGSSWCLPDYLETIERM